MWRSRTDQRQRRRRELPIEVVEEILVHSRAVDLVRYKFVCRVWFDLISSQRFVNKHLHQSSSNTKIITTSKTTRHGIVKAVSLSLRDEPPQAYVALPLQNAEIVGSCNGILCLALDRGPVSVCLFNPSTRESRMSPCIPDLKSDDCIYAMGFGYDVRTDDYKVVKITSKEKGISGSLESYFQYFVEIWSRNTHSWRKISSPVLSKQPIYTAYRKPGVFLRGKLYWARCQEMGSPSISALISFDMGDETFRTIKILQNIVANDVGSYPGIIDFMGSLAVPVYTGPGEYTIWVLGEDGRTWTRQSTIGSFQSHRALDSHRACPMGVCIGGKFLMRMNNKFFLYDPLMGEEEKKFSGFQFNRKWYHCRIGHICWSFVESLVSVRSEP